MDQLTDRLIKVIAKNYIKSSLTWDLSRICNSIHFEMREIWKKKALINNQLFQSKPWIHEILQISATDKLVDIDPWNFDTKNVKQYTEGGKKEKYRVMTMSGTPSIHYEFWEPPGRFLDNCQFPFSLVQSSHPGIKIQVWKKIFHPTLLEKNPKFTILHPILHTRFSDQV